MTRIATQTLLALSAWLLAAPLQAQSPAPAAAPAQAASPAGVPQAAMTPAVPSLAPMIRRVSPAVVNIATRGTIRERAPRNPLLEDPFFRRFFDVPPDGGQRERPFQSAGSGVIIDAKAGHIITNAHVVENASEITVTLQDGRDLKAEVVGADSPSDVAVLKVQPDRLTDIALGDSDRLEVGDFVVAIGNPFGLQHTVTSGIVSALGRSGISRDGFEDFIQTDASINPGNSGGALVNLRGELVGINSAILSRSGGNIGIGFAIPSNLARGVLDQLIKYGSVKRGVLGVNIAPVTPDVAQALGLQAATGALVTQVVEKSAADKAGIRAGDVITAVNGRAVKSHTELRNAVGLLRVGERIEIALLRDGRSQRVAALIESPPEEAATPAAPGGEPPKPLHPGLAGAVLADAPNGAGVLVRSVAQDGAAFAAGLRANDVIVGANRTRVTSLAQLREATRNATSLVLNVRRGDRGLVILLR
jgi:serine protease Do/serine protease DegQ